MSAYSTFTPDNLQIEKIAILFSLLSAQDASDYHPLISLSILEVNKMLKPFLAETQYDDPRLLYLCAAVANLRYVQISSMKLPQELTFAGSVSSASNNNNNSRLSIAQSTVREFRGVCADLVLDDFIFINSTPIPKLKEVNINEPSCNN